MMMTDVGKVMTLTTMMSSDVVVFDIVIIVPVVAFVVFAFLLRLHCWSARLFVMIFVGVNSAQVISRAPTGPLCQLQHPLFHMGPLLMGWQC